MHAVTGQCECVTKAVDQGSHHRLKWIKGANTNGVCYKPVGSREPTPLAHHCIKLGSGMLGGGGRFLKLSPRARAAVT
eukprot:1157975-Pelagomonas_calceolata.AAC.4